jgi:ribonuclease T2
MHEEIRWGGCGAGPRSSISGKFASYIGAEAAGGKRQCVSGHSASAVALSVPAREPWAEGETAGDFDYYVLSLSVDADMVRAGRRRPEQSRNATGGRVLGFTLHGLWPQYEDGWPSFCPRRCARQRGQTGAMADIMGSSGLGLAPVAQARGCSGAVVRGLFRPVAAGLRPGRAPRRAAPPRPRGPPARHVIEEAFLEANPDLEPDMLTVTCRAGRVQEVRLCLTRSAGATRLRR